MNMSVEKKKYPSALPSNWPIKDDSSRKNQNPLPSSGKVDVYYYRLYFFIRVIFILLSNE